MIQLTRLGHGETFLLNPDLFERIDSHVDTVVRLTNGNEYVVSESASDIIERIVVFRAHVLAAVPLLNRPATDDRAADGEPVVASRIDEPPRELSPIEQSIPVSSEVGR